MHAFLSVFCEGCRCDSTGPCCATCPARQSCALHCISRKLIGIGQKLRHVLTTVGCQAITVWQCTSLRQGAWQHMKAPSTATHATLPSLTCVLSNKHTSVQCTHLCVHGAANAAVHYTQSGSYRWPRNARCMVRSAALHTLECQHKSLLCSLLHRSCDADICTRHHEAGSFSQCGGANAAHSFIQLIITMCSMAADICTRHHKAGSAVQPRQ